jgi:AmmeMemoRadiSam system protein B
MQFPRFRDDLIIDEFHEGNSKFVAISDEIGIIQEPIALPLNIFDFINNSSEITFDEAKVNFKNEISENYPDDFLSNIIKNLEQLGFLDTPQIRIYQDSIKDYLRSDVRPASCSGFSYPEDRAKLKDYLNDILSSSENDSRKFDKLMAPHIDFKIGSNAHKIYAKTFSRLETDFDLAILIGTAHYKSSDDFMFTKKHFETPLGVVETDLNFISEIESISVSGITYDDLAHRMEHSLELHLILLQYLMQNKEFKILPILTGSFHHYLQNDFNPEDNPRFQNVIDSIQKTISQSEKKVIILGSGDLSHIGRKFGHKYDAKEKLDVTKEFDEDVISSLVKMDSNSFYNIIKKNKNDTNICGLSPFYSMMKISPLIEADFAGYHQWNEYDTQSAVSFCGINFK